MERSAWLRFWRTYQSRTMRMLLSIIKESNSDIWDLSVLRLVKWFLLQLHTQEYRTYSWSDFIEATTGFPSLLTPFFEFGRVWQFTSVNRAKAAWYLHHVQLKACCSWPEPCLLCSADYSGSLEYFTSNQFTQLLEKINYDEAIASLVCLQLTMIDENTANVI